jgi:hypothetical protein
MPRSRAGVPCAAPCRAGGPTPGRGLPARALLRHEAVRRRRNLDWPVELTERRVPGVGALVRVGDAALRLTVAVARHARCLRRGCSHESRAPTSIDIEPGIFAELVAISSTRSGVCFGFRLLHRVDRAWSYFRSSTRCTQRVTSLRAQLIRRNSDSGVWLCRSLRLIDLRVCASVPGHAGTRFSTAASSSTRIRT